MKITREDAKAFFAHSSQRIMGLDELPGEPFRYYASGDVCLAFHDTFWPGVHMVHVGMKPEGRGRSDWHTARLLHEYADDTGASRITAWIDGKNRAAIAYAKRAGFEEDGEMKLETGTVKMLGWRR